jgi:hypothetical protein
MQQRPPVEGEQSPSQQEGRVGPQAPPSEVQSGGSAVVVGASQDVPGVQKPLQQTASGSTPQTEPLLISTTQVRSAVQLTHAWLSP